MAGLPVGAIRSVVACQIAVARDDDRRSSFGQADGDGLSDAAGGSGHERDPSSVGLLVGCCVGHHCSPSVVSGVAYSTP